MRHEALLCAVYDRWLKRNALPAMSADELRYELWFRVGGDPWARTPRVLRLRGQIDWLERFIMAWDRASA